MRPPALVIGSMPAGAMLLAGAIGASVGACGSESMGRGEPIGVVDGGGAGGGDFMFDAGPTGPPPPDAGGLCGNQVHQIIGDAPNVYFVIDTSGSMGANAGNGYSRYAYVRNAAIGLVTALGPLINVGAALFPIGVTDNATACNAGGQVFPVTPGDPSGIGTTTTGFSNATLVKPIGGTPTAATLRGLQPIVTSLAGRTILVLATDGGPNCNPDAVCTGDECMINLEACDPSWSCCAAGGNCCTSNTPGGPENCVDRDATVEAVADLEAAGVTVYVIGITGSELYGTVLSDMAIAGGAPLAAPPFYYKVDDLDTLQGVLGSIAAVAISCEFELDDPPEELGFTNVYLDKTLLPQGFEDGWVWKTVSTVELRGAACKKLKSGQVKQVQIVSGCPTEAAK